MAVEPPLRSRKRLQSLLETLFGSQEVHFQPPTNVELMYPCIIYKRDTADKTFADNRPYSYLQRYQVMVISKTPEHPVLEKLSALPLCSEGTTYVAEQLNHDVFNLYF